MIRLLNFLTPYVLATHYTLRTRQRKVDQVAKGSKKNKFLLLIKDSADISEVDCNLLKDWGFNSHDGL